MSFDAKNKDDSENKHVVVKCLLRLTRFDWFGCLPLGDLLLHMVVEALVDLA